MICQEPALILADLVESAGLELFGARGPGGPVGGASEAMIVNLNQYRKKRRRVEAEARAKENRIRFGRSKEERNKELRERERAKKEIEDKRLD
jgi:hypothetical protein